MTMLATTNANPNFAAGPSGLKFYQLQKAMSNELVSDITDLAYLVCSEASLPPLV